MTSDYLKRNINTFATGDESTWESDFSKYITTDRSLDEEISPLNIFEVLLYLIKNFIQIN